jgi:antibiotic biosynthesis monooxygenase (ABM) superfamily enzyme
MTTETVEFTAAQVTAAEFTATRTARETRTAPAPSIHRRLLLTWLAVYPTITVVQMLLGTSVAHLALPVRTLIVTALVAPVVVYLALPQILKADRKIAKAWVNRGR